MASQKSSGVIEALKGRKGFGSKKGVSLLGLMKKLSEKRSKNKKDSTKHESNESSSKESSEESMMNGKGGCGTKK